jgi:ATP-dependent helicase/nuclease subunit B
MLEQLDGALSEGSAGQYVPVAEVLELIAGLLREMQKVAGAEAVPPPELAGWLEYGLSSLTHAQPPPVLDCVLVTEAERGRNPDVRHTLLLGLSEGIWPSSLAEPPLLSDRERAQLNRGGRTLIPGGAEEAAARGPYNLLVAATRASDTLYLSRPLAAADGRVLRPSPYFAMLAELLGVEKPAALAGAGQLVSLADLAALISLSPGDRGLNLLTDELMAAGEPGSAAEHASRGLAWGRRIAAAHGDSLRLDTAALLGGEPVGGKLTLRMSASRLEEFAACPFKHYASYFLRLSDRSPAEFTPALLGSLYHHVFDEAVERLEGSGHDWLSGDPVPVRDALLTVLEELRDEFAELANRRRAAYILERAQLLCDLHASWMAQTAAENRRIPRYSELRFGPEPGAELPAVRIATDAAEVLLSGYIDRVDAGPSGATVVDYKLSGRPVQWDMFLAGRQLQLPVYMLAIAEAGDPSLAPGQAEFQPVEPDWSANDRASLRSTGMPQHGRSKNQPDGGNAAAISGILGETRRIIGELAGRLLSGEIAAQPLRQGGGKWVACSSCSFRSVCRFDPAAGARYRDATPGSPAQLRDRIMAGESFPGSAGCAADQAGGGDQGAGDG